MPKNYKKQTKTKLGFTLVELLVTLGIIMLMLAVGLPYFRDFDKRSQLDDAVQVMRDGILTAKSLSLAPNINKRAGVDQYAITFVTDSNSFQIGDYDPNKNPALNVVNTIKLPEHIKINNTAMIAFSIVGQGKISCVIACPPEITIILSHEQLAFENTRLVKINTQTGLVSE